MSTSKSARWRGDRGEWYVVVQFAFFMLIIFGPQDFPGMPPWPEGLGGLFQIGGTTLVVLGGVISILAVFQLGSNLTPLPHPKEGATLIVTNLPLKSRPSDLVACNL